jgi:Sec-independent protein translocase protein TatA
MEFLGVGPLELFFILVIALIVLGPADMVKAGRTLGRVMRKIVTSPNWRLLQETSREIRYLPNRLMREAGMEELQKELPNPKQISQELGLDQLKTQTAAFNKDLSDWTTPPTIGNLDAPPEASEPESSTANITTADPSTADSATTDPTTADLSSSTDQN